MNISKFQWSTITCATLRAWAAVPILLAGSTLGVLPATTSAAATVADSVSEFAIVATRRITESQYKNTIAHVFGESVKVNGRFEPEQRTELLLAIGSSQLSISAAGFNQYFAMARSVAGQVLTEENRARYLNCQPANASAPDDQCTAQFVREYGRLLFRRPLSDGEVASRVRLAAEGATSRANFYYGAELALTSLLSAPEFLFRIELAEPGPTKKAYRLDAYTRAARLSHLLWDSSPDEELLQAAAKGELYTSRGVKRQIERMLNSPRLEQGTRAFFSDMLHLDRYATLTKDSQIFPKFSQTVADSAKEQTLKTVVHHLLEEDGDYRELLTTRETFMNRPLAAVYKIPFLAEEGAEDGWTAYTFPEDSQQSGLITQMSLAAVFSHPGRSSPTLRGVGINEIFLCSPTPLPPANVDFSIINDTNNPNLKTSRLRLEAHAEDPACSGCHRMIDPIGLALEHFDAMAQPRLFENNELIDVSAELFGVAFEGARGLGEYLYNSEKAHSCLVRNVYAYGVGREPSTREQNGYLAEQTGAFAESGFNFKKLLRAIATTEKFFEVPESDIITTRLNEQHQVAGDI